MRANCSPDAVHLLDWAPQEMMRRVFFGTQFLLQDRELRRSVKLNCSTEYTAGYCECLEGHTYIYYRKGFCCQCGLCQLSQLSYIHITLYSGAMHNKNPSRPETGCRDSSQYSTTVTSETDIECALRTITHDPRTRNWNQEGVAKRQTD